MKPKFLCDAMLGSLARWLRLFGYDCTFSADLDDQQLARLARAEGRWLLTRDRELAAAGPRTVLVRSCKLEEQLREVFERRRLCPHPGMEQARCGVCNGELLPVEPSLVATLVPAHVAQSTEQLRLCGGCRRVYWPGTHVDRILDRMRRVVASVSEC